MSGFVLLFKISENSLNKCKPFKTFGKAVYFEQRCQNRLLKNLNSSKPPEILNSNKTIPKITFKPSNHGL